MIDKIKKIILEKYLEVRLKLITDKTDAYNFPALINNLKNALIILPQHTEKFIHEFPSRLYSAFPGINISTFDISGLRKSDCNWLGVPHVHYLDQVRDGNFDMVIDLNLIPDKICSYITAFSGALIKINLVSGPYDHIYNLQIKSAENKSIPEKLENIIKYLYVLKKSDQSGSKPE
ncbi:MAG: hypothetical protein JXR46_06345 [Calditrichaceae bacterium]|nr:hypothetical protein [Calditrichaceae bacterium]MBN2708647.1 hypothetical protein [Calditrichaceae bacterium]RQV92017.1 MAG: hypothetical protein EH224_16580 [Calditrichota bacterium]